MSRAPFLLALVGGCQVFQANPCEELTLEVCDQCAVSDITDDLVCACVEDGEVNRAADYFETKKDSEMFCSDLLLQLQQEYEDESTRKECERELAMFDEYGDDACRYYDYDEE